VDGNSIKEPNMTPSRPATSRDVRRIAANLRADKEWSILPNRLESAADLIDALTARVAELEETIEAMNDPKSVGNPTWLAYQMEERAMKAEAENARLREACDMAAFKLEYAASILEAHSATATVAMGMSELASQLRTALKEQP
jgi:hypothetical protein